jgi:hypothetical protein
MSLLRVVSDLGYRKQKGIVSGCLITMMEGSEQISIDEPFLAASSRFEKADPEQGIGSWCLASLLET